MRAVEHIIGRQFGLFVIAATVATAGCGSRDETSDELFQQAAVHVSSDILDEYVGVYELPSGAMFPVTRKHDRLYGGTPPTELYAQTTRRFTSNGFFGEIRFDRDAKGNVHRLDYRLAKHTQWCNRVASDAVDPSQLIDAGGFRLRMLKIGQGSPTIILEDGFGNGLQMQSSLQAALSEVSSVIAYDHAGTGGSDPGPDPRDAQQIARELRMALGNAGVEPPFILVGGSIGGDYCRVFADLHPGEVAGLVLLDSTPDWDELLRWSEVNAPGRADNYRQLRDETDAVMHKLMHRLEVGRRAEWEQLSRTRRQAHEALPRLQIPVTQITGGAGRQYSSVVDDKVRFFDAWLDEYIPHAKHEIASNSAHAVSITDQALVVDQVRRLIRELDAPMRGAD